MTGWGRGLCQGSATPVDARGGFGGGWGRGRGLGRGGGGRGWRNWYRATGLPGWFRGRSEAPALDEIENTPETELQTLRQRSAFLESELEAIRKRLDELGTATPEAK
jgi:hypothetical protein